MKCIIVEDEAPAIKLLKSYIDKTSFLECIGVFETISDLPVGILDNIDFMFLDIQLPGINGLDFLKNLERKPRIIITTAYRDYAIEAFEVAVDDFLLKPFSYDRFLKSVYRLQQEIRPTTDATENKNKLFLYADKTFYNINKQDIVYIKAEVDYVTVFYGTEHLLIQSSLNHWENKLRQDGFIRVHRSYLINADKIIKIEGNMIHIHNAIIPIGKTYRAAFFDTIRNLF